MTKKAIKPHDTLQYVLHDAVSDKQAVGQTPDEAYINWFKIIIISQNNENVAISNILYE